MKMHVKKKTLRIIYGIYIVYNVYSVLILYYYKYLFIFFYNIDHYLAQQLVI